MILFIIAITVFISATLLYLPPITRFFDFEQLNLFQLGVSFLIGFISVVWYELVKLRERMRKS